MLTTFQEAVRLYTESVNLDNQNTAALFNRAAAQMALRRFQPALSDCQMVIAQQGVPRQSKTLARLGKIQLALGQIDAASSSLTEARETAEPSALNAIQMDLTKVDRIRQHLNTIDRERKNKEWGMVVFGLNQILQEVDSPPLQWRIWKLEALVQKKSFSEATFLAT